MKLSHKLHIIHQEGMVAMASAVCKHICILFTELYDAKSQTLLDAYKAEHLLSVTDLCLYWRRATCPGLQVASLTCATMPSTIMCCMGDVIGALFHGKVNFRAVLNGLPTACAMAVVCTLCCSLHAPALKKHTGRLIASASATTVSAFFFRNNTTDSTEGTPHINTKKSKNNIEVSSFSFAPISPIKMKAASRRVSSANNSIFCQHGEAIKPPLLGCEQRPNIKCHSWLSLCYS
eukprot:11339184-Ditylum_brightwellii.AAC.1